MTYDSYISKILGRSELIGNYSMRECLRIFLYSCISICIQCPVILHQRAVEASFHDMYRSMSQLISR